jgi:hypothetical protein
MVDEQKENISQLWDTPAVTDVMYYVLPLSSNYCEQ